MAAELVSGFDHHDPEIEAMMQARAHAQAQLPEARARRVIRPLRAGHVVLADDDSDPLADDPVYVPMSVEFVVDAEVAFRALAAASAAASAAIQDGVARYLSDRGA